MKRAFLIVLDGLGIGAATDASAYGDAGSDTLGNVARAVGGLDGLLPRTSRWSFDVRLESGKGGWRIASAAWSRLEDD